MTDQLTYMTDAHKAVIKQLERWGLGVMEEVDFPPFRADCYLPDYHCVVEVDGPQHSEKADNKRDRELCDVYGLFVFHISSKDVNKLSELNWNMWKEKLRLFLIRAKIDKNERWESCKMKTPWL